MRSQRPAWLDKKIDFRALHGTEHRLRDLGLHTVCHQARCPNISECFSRGTATFLILGDTCTRHCPFCAVKHGSPLPPDPGEPARAAEAVRRMDIRHAVITSVTRDDLPDGGAGAFAAVIAELRKPDGPATIEVLVPDFRGDENSIRTVAVAGPDIFGHNMETVPSLYGARGNCDYRRSLDVLGCAKRHSPAMKTKSAIMVGLGETEDEVFAVMGDLRSVKCDYLSIGQYLRPGKGNLPVREYVAPEQFERYKDTALELGFLHVESGAYVRSSYMADRYR
ncbi:MAG TPA: lipoyl synthase [Spirochaetota bacterium]|nr:lipoyl synthase [Spirochaetota bacterium]HPC42449.1 lipoyl synthase [Spirochaetota bacterium]HPL17408.1 lipoyl synthase [Spirochaetota bacterium]HQF06564.1 lipoyl synthase [Spirochaetota bacterium]HQH96033.1 lipoyl synthase [Spirochaetota bacterium]